MFLPAQVRPAEGAEMLTSLYITLRFSPSPIERTEKEKLQLYFESTVLATWHINQKYNFDVPDPGGQMKMTEMFLFFFFLK